MRKLMWLALALFLPGTSHAQQTSLADVSAGYSYFRLGGSGGDNLNGLSGSAALNANSWLGVVGDLGVYHGSPAGVGLTTATYTVGPRVSYHMENLVPVVPFVQALFGGSHLSAGGASSNPFTFGFGGGADLGNGRIALRPQLDYLGLHSAGVTTNCIRISVGLVFHIGER